MRGLDPRIYGYLHTAGKDVDGRDKPGHDTGSVSGNEETKRALKPNLLSE
jgi:hypothetical protein